jgi:hypothetical protein
MDSRFSSAAVSGMAGDRNTMSSSRKPMARTSAMMGSSRLASKAPRSM